MVSENLLSRNPSNSGLSHTSYLELRTEIDSLCLKLEKVHKEHIACSAGCHQCCMDFSIFPVEFFSIIKEISESKINIKTDIPEDDCVFLINGLCSIYASRPVICRTHGLPMLQMGEDEWQLSYCELNFTDGSLPEFTESDTFPQDSFNSRLFLINREFIRTLTDNQYSDTDLISLRELGEKLTEQTSFAKASVVEGRIGSKAE
jgi:Fe-S-cluster containining protein